MKIGIIGAGISGLTCAWLLHGTHDITVYEANNYAGGHANTAHVELEGRGYEVDTGFIVFNRTTYINFCRILDRIGVTPKATRMDFSFKSEIDGTEYNSRTLETTFAQKKNMLSLSFYRMFLDAIKFGREFDRILAEEGEWEIDEYLEKRGYSRRFIDQMIIPLGASLWSADPERFRTFPVKTFVRYFKNHGFLGGEKHIHWLVIDGGSRRYVEKMTEAFTDRIRLEARVLKVSRYPGGVRVRTTSGEEEFDQVIMAVHSNEALDILEDPTPGEREILGDLPYQQNQAYLHTDSSILPGNPKAWASWNYLLPREGKGRVAVTYDMNILQGLAAPAEFCVTLNYPEHIKAERILGCYEYSHPQYDPKAIEAQKRRGEISGADRIHYCGAYWGYGFHEDGARSAFEVCEKLGVKFS